MAKYRKGWIVMDGGEFEGLWSYGQPYRVYLTKRAAKNELKRRQKECSEPGIVEVILPDER